MNIAVIGKSGVNTDLKKYIAAEGYIPIVFEDIRDIKGFDGEKGSFAIRTDRACIKAGYVIVAVEPDLERSAAEAFGDMPVLSLHSFNTSAAMPGNRSPVVFLLDYPNESPGYITRLALQKAVGLARRRCRVVFLARFVRTEGSQAEALYREARRQGVTFIKYRDLSLEYDRDSGVFSVDASDELEDFRINTKTVVACPITVLAEELQTIERILKLRPDGYGLLDSDRHFMFPGLTNRKGIYRLFVIPGDGFKDELLTQLEYILSDIDKEEGYPARFATTCALGLQIYRCFSNARETAGKYAVINEAKCALCYTCYRACPHSAMAPDSEKPVMKNLKNACAACGICAAVCPAEAIKIEDEGGRIEEEAAMGLEILCCENSGLIAAEKLKDEMGVDFDDIRVTPVSCSGGISTGMIIAALRRSRKVLVATCMDDACRHLDGNRRALRRAEKARRLLRALGVDEDRVECVGISHAMPAVLGEYVKKSADTRKGESMP